MKRLSILMLLLGGVVLWPVGADAHCDAVDGPVATAALKALETKNVNLILPYAPAEAEAELAAAFGQALVVRTKGPEAKALADRYFMETAVRLHRAGEHAPYTGLQPAGTDFGPAIPAAEKALESGALEPVLTLISQEVARGITKRFEQARAKKGVTKEPLAATGVPLARERVRAELDFIGYVERLHLATRGGGHAE
jgi:hypothetical protein